MLPTKGYFQDIECPFYENACNRPYCHFRHRKKGPETSEDVSNEAPPEAEVPTYKPTPKSELEQIKSHIPISYVPDLAFKPTRSVRTIPKFSFEKPTYNPTPLTILSSADNPVSTEDGDDDDLKVIREIQQDKANSEYNPVISLNEDIDFDHLSAEIDLIDDLIDNKVKEKNKASKKIDDDKKSTNESASKVEKKEKSSKSSSSKSRSSHRSHSSKSKHHAKDKEKSKTSSSSSSSKHKSKDKERRHSSSSDHKHRSSSHKKSREKSTKEKRKEKTEHMESNGLSGSDFDEIEEEKNTLHRSSSSHKKSREKSAKEKASRHKDSDSESDHQNDDFMESKSFSESDFDEIEEENTLLECYKIFNEYKPPKPEHEQIQIVVEKQSLEIPETSSSKKRIAHASSGAESGSKIQHMKPKIIQSAAQVMQNRFKQAREAQASNEQKNLMNVVKETIKRPPPPSLLEAAKEFKIRKLAKSVVQDSAPSCNVIDSILNGNRNKPKKIAPVMNVSMIQRAKARVDEVAKQKALEALKTPAQTAKGTKRVAHVPDVSLSDIPDVLNADKSKLPINVRTRFLTMIADECVKLYLIKEDAYNRALTEEFSCYEKCKVLATYRNSAMLAVNRLRKELQEREKQNLGPIGTDEASNKNSKSEYKGEKFYNRITQYVLTDSELDIHGYPKESSIPGRAVIKNRLNNSKSLNNLNENQRKCARCSKIYIVDDDGFPMYDEECIYHPLKKRTLRGEQTYLCCKSNDGTGCATANTHVCDLPEDAELDGFQTTMPPGSENDPRSHQVYALDCEMCYTTKGLELTRVTIVDSDCKTVYESLVKPWNPIIDYNTTFSGITKEQMDKTSTSILQVQANILHLCNSRTILIGHSLESDMKALKIVHGNIIDTAVLFPHKMGLPHKRALRVLASEFLKKIIQNSVSGHDSAEDAIACMELVKWKVKEESKLKGGK